MPEKSPWLPRIEVLFAVLVWGASFIATKVALKDALPATVVWLRFAIGIPVLGALLVARRQLALPSRSDLPYFALLGFIGITFHQWLQSTGLQTAQASTTAWIITTTPVFIAILSWLFLKEYLGPWRVLGILVAAVGVILVVSHGDLKALWAGQAWTPGDLLIVISAPNWAVFSVLSRRGLHQHPAARMMFYVMLAGWVMTSALFFAGPGLQDVGRLTLDGWLGVAFLGIFCTGLAYVAWYDGLQAVPTAQVGAFLYIEPLTAVVTAALILGEALSAASLVGGATILLGVWMVNRK